MATKPNVIKISFRGKARRFPYPEKKISEFLEDLKGEYSLPSDVRLQLLDGEEELSKSSSLNDLCIEKASELKLIETDNSLTLKIQDITGTTYSFELSASAKLKDLYDMIRKRIDCTTAYPLLFNHRMHIFVTPEFLETPLTELLNLTLITGEKVPHFYLFQCDRQFESHAYDYSSNLKDIFIMHDLWQPKSCQQTNEAMQIYLNVLFALVRVFLTAREADFDSIHHIYMPQFLITLRKYLFPPACLALKHAFEGALFNFEKVLLGEAFFHLFRRLLPTSITDNELFFYTPHIFCWIFDNSDQASPESACYEHAQLYDDQKKTDPFSKPVRLLTDKIKTSASERFVLMEYDEVQKLPGISTDDYQLQTDLIGLLLFMENSRRKMAIPGATASSVFEIFTSEFTLWSPSARVNLLSIADVNEQKHNTTCLKLEQLDDLNKQLATNDLYSIFTFADPSKLSKHNHAQLVLLQSGKIVYIKSAAKNNDDSFICFDPSNEQEEFEKSDAATNEVLMSKQYIVIRENAVDIRKIEQITCILFDISGSMHVMVGDEDNKETLLALSTQAFGAWRDRLNSYKLPHAVGLIYFGANDEPTGDSPITYFRVRPQIVVQCEVTRDFLQFEKALSNPPECGYETPLYDAIHRAIQKVRSYRESHRGRLSPTCKELILCLTDGVDSCSRVAPSRILENLLQDKIVFDAISFDKEPNSTLIELCEKTKGYYYENISHDKTYMLNLFELEAAISIQDRDETVHGRITQPQRRKPKLLDKPAVAAKGAKVGDGRASSISMKRIMQEINQLNKSDMPNFELFVSQENIFFWKLIMHGETGTPYAGGRWLLSVEFPLNFPQQPPEIRFVTKIYHCNVNDDGKICHDILTSAWSQKTSLYNVFMEILRLLREPNADDALSSVKGSLYKESEEKYNNTVKEWKQKYASTSVEELKKLYALE